MKKFLITFLAIELLFFGGVVLAQNWGYWATWYIDTDGTYRQVYPDSDVNLGSGDFTTTGTGTFGDLVATGTITGEQLTSTDDATITDLLSAARGELTATGTTMNTLILKGKSLIGTASFSGTGNDDLTSEGTYYGTDTRNYKIEIDAGDPTDPNTFRWSNDNGSTWEVEDVAITGSAQNLEDGVVATFGNAIGHVATPTADYWTFATTPYTGDFVRWTNPVGSIWGVIDEQGRMGIGNSSPNEKLEVTGNIRLTADGDKVIMGAGEDLELYHDGNDGRMDVNTGDFIVTGAATFDFTAANLKTTGSITASEIGSIIIVDSVTYERTDVGIQAAIDSLGTDGGEVFLPVGAYTINAWIKVPSNTTIRGAGYNTILTIADNANVGGIINSDTSGGNVNIIIESLHLEGNKANQAAVGTKGVELQNVTGGRVSGVWANDFQGAGVSAHRGIGILINNSHYIVVENCYADSNNYDNIGVRWGCTNVIVTNCVGTNAVGRAGIQVVNSNNIVVSDNVTTGNGNSGIALHGVTNSSVTGNTTNNNTGQGIHLISPTVDDLTYDITVSGNTSNSNTGAGIYIERYVTALVKNISISGNTLDANGTSGIRIEPGVEQVTIDGNSFSENTVESIYVEGDGIIISNNNVASNDSGFGDIKVHGTNVSITGNYLESSAGYVARGIYLGGGSDEVTITGNTTIGHDTAGIEVNTTYTTAHIFGNNFIESTSIINNSSGGTYMAFVDFGGVGKTVDPISPWQVESDVNAFTDTDEPENYHLFLRNPASDLNEGVGIAFGISSVTDDVGAGIIYKRTDSAMKGELQFYTKQNTTIDGTISEVMTLQDDGIIWVGNKIIYTQTDGNEFIDSLNDGYMDYGATTQHRFNNDVFIASGKKLGIGTDPTYIIDSTAVTGGHLALRVHRDINTEGSSVWGDWAMDNDAGEVTTLGRIAGVMVDNTDGTEDGQLSLRAMVNGTVTEKAYVDSTGMVLTNGGVLQVNSAGDDKNVQLAHNDTNATLAVSSGDFYISAVGGDINLNDDNLTTTGKVGIGVAPSATYELSIQSSDNQVFSATNTQASGTYSGAGFYFAENDGAAVVSGDRLGYLIFAGSINASSTGAGAIIQAYAAGTFSTTSYPADLQFKTVPAGSTTSDVRLLIASTGDIHIPNDSAKLGFGVAALTDSYIQWDTAGLDFYSSGGIYDFNAAANTDLTFNFAGTTNSGVITWMENEDLFKFSDDIQFPDNEKTIFGTDSDMSIYFDNTDWFFDMSSAPSTPGAFAFKFFDNYGVTTFEMIDSDDVGVFAINSDGDVFMSGDITFTGTGAGLAYGSLYAYEVTETVACTQNVYAQFDGGVLTTGEVNNVTAVATVDSMSVDIAGVYKMDWSMSGESVGAGDGFDFSVFLSGVEQSDGSAFRYFANANQKGNWGATAIIRASASDYFEVRIKNNDANDDIIIYDANINVTLIGG